MVRLVRGPAGEVAVDLGGGASGRGAHVHARPDCLAKACKAGLARSFKGKVAATRPEELAAQLVAACDRRIRGLILAAARTRRVALGADATLEALAAHPEARIVVATDAGNIASRRPIMDAVASGRAVAWGDKATLGGLTGKADVAVMAVLDDAIAEELSKARRMADAVESSRFDACSIRSEVR